MRDLVATRKGVDASWGDLADDEIWGPAKRCHALFSRRCTALCWRRGKESQQWKWEKRGERKKRDRKKEMPFDVGEQICTFCHPPTILILSPFTDRLILSPIWVQTVPWSWYAPISYNHHHFYRCRALYTSKSSGDGLWSHSLHKIQISRLSIFAFVVPCPLGNVWNIIKLAFIQLSV